MARNPQARMEWVDEIQRYQKLMDIAVTDTSELEDDWDKIYARKSRSQQSTAVENARIHRVIAEQAKIAGEARNN